MIFEREIYENLRKWKEETKGSKALLIEGARRIGKSTVVEEFAKHEYESYLLIDFNDVSDVVKDAFNNHLNDLSLFFMLLRTEYNVELHERSSLIIFDEIQQFPKARQSIKKLVKDGRYDYIETGSLISIKENVKNITIPSEERVLQMYPLSFKEFAKALKQEAIIEYIQYCFNNSMELNNDMHKKAMYLFKQYMIVGGMPQSVKAYLENDYSFHASDIEKRDILNLYRADMMQIDVKYKAKVLSVFDNIPGYLSRKEKRVVLSDMGNNATFEKYSESFFWLADSKICNECFNTSDPNIGLGLNSTRTYIKCYMGDTGLLLSHAFNENEIEREELYKQIINDKLSINEGMFYENIIGQMLVKNGYKLYFYNSYNREKKRTDIEIDFIISNNSISKYKIFPIEVKSTKTYQYNSMKKFNNKFKKRIGISYIIHPKNLSYLEEEKIMKIPVYMTFCL